VVDGAWGNMEGWHIRVLKSTSCIFSTRPDKSDGGTRVMDEATSRTAGTHSAGAGTDAGADAGAWASVGAGAGGERPGVISRIREPVNCLTHLAGALAAVLCTAALLYRSAPYGARYTVSFAIFGASLILLYTASAVYHMLHVSEGTQQLLRRIDHTMIFVLIAGTYTPVCLIALRGAWGWSIFGVIWGLALSGLFMKIFWLQAPRALSTTIYVIMGWLVVVAFYPLLRAISTPAFVLLLLGGLSYTAGAVFYALKRPALHNRYFGFHEIFHCFVLLGSAFHVLFMFLIIP
ncbi:hemolysin III family protein, partial [Desulfovibrio sp. OttesenSCG-928-A18]|nr:hemolysin III family protein [Desulfovibrio sp. OttesenSCG-928-A18]